MWNDHICVKTQCHSHHWTAHTCFSTVNTNFWYCLRRAQTQLFNLFFNIPQMLAEVICMDMYMSKNKRTMSCLSTLVSPMTWTWIQRLPNGEHTSSTKKTRAVIQLPPTLYHCSVNTWFVDFHAINRLVFKCKIYFFMQHLEFRCPRDLACSMWVSCSRDIKTVHIPPFNTLSLRSPAFFVCVYA